MEKIAKREKYFGKNPFHPTGEIMFLAQKGENQSHDSSREYGNERGRERMNFKWWGGRHNHAENSDLQYVCCGKK